MPQEIIIVDTQRTSRKSAKVTDRGEVSVNVGNNVENPIPIITSGTQSDILNVASTTTGTFNTECTEIYIMNTGSSDILINGKTVGAGLSFPWKGNFTYDSQLSTIMIIFTV